MNKLGALMAGTATAAVLALADPVAAGPCTDQINEVARALSNDPSLGPPTTGALAGAAPGAIQNKAPMPAAGTAAESKETPPAPSLAKDGKTGGEAGMKEMNAASSQIATSAQDVRLQQQGQPTAAQGGNLSVVSDKMTMAKTELDKARMLDAQGSADCAGALDKARQAMGS